MKEIGKLKWTLILPLSIILFGTITKWRYVLVEDGPDEFLYGFPLTFICSGWHTSMSLQIFVAELIFDFFVYLIFCLIVITLIDKYIKRIIIPKFLKVVLYVLTTLTIFVYGIRFSNRDNIFHLKRDFNYKEIRSGYKFVWEQDKR
jgi:hypothetical protein